MLKRFLIAFVRRDSVRIVWSSLVRSLLALGGVRAAAYLTVLGIDWRIKNRSFPTVLCITRDFFIKDIDELEKRTNLNYACILGGYSRFQERWVPEKAREQTFYQTAQIVDRERVTRTKRRYAERVLQLVRKRTEVDAVMSANFDYWQDEGFKIVCGEEGIPFLVLSREHPVIENVVKIERDARYKKGDYRFIGTAVAVGGERSVRMIQEVVDRDKIWITGFPRLDAWREIDSSMPFLNRKYITLLTYTEGYYADQGFKEMLLLFARASAELKDQSASFLVKCKNYDDQQVVRGMLKGAGQHHLKLVHDTPLYELLPQSRLVIGFNSLAVVEAVLSRANLAIPFWGDHKNDPGNLMFYPGHEPYQGYIHFPNNQEEMTSIIRRAAFGEGEILPYKKSREIAGTFFYIPDPETSSDKVEEFILHHIKKKQSERAL